MDKIVISLIEDDPDYIEQFKENFENKFKNDDTLELVCYDFSYDIDTRFEETIEGLFSTDIAIVDFSIPKYDGISIMCRFREDYKNRLGISFSATDNPYPIFIMHTAFNDDIKIYKMAVESGFQEFLTISKSDTKSLMQSLDKYIDQRKVKIDEFKKFNDFIYRQNDMWEKIYNGLRIRDE